MRLCYQPKRKISGIEIDAFFDFEDQEYTAYTDDATITLIKELYGTDADGRRGVVRHYIEDAEIPIDTVQVFDEDDTPVYSQYILPKAKAALIEKLYDYDYSTLL